MAAISPQKAAELAMLAPTVNAAGASIVSGETGEQGLFAKLAQLATTATKSVLTNTLGITSPAGAAAPQTTSAAVKVLNASSQAVKTTAEGVRKVAESAGSGIKTGFTIGVAALVVVGFLFLRHHLK